MATMERLYPLARTILLWTCLVINAVFTFADLPPITSARFRDFGSFWASGTLLAAGSNPYGYHPLVNDAGAAVNLNPPPSLFLCRLFAALDPLVGFWAWTTASIILYGVTLLLLRQTYPRDWTRSHWLWAWSLAGFWYTLWQGQIWTVIPLLTTLTWCALRWNRSSAAAIPLAVLVAVKPNFALWPLIMFLAGYRRPSVLAGAFAAMLYALPLVLYGPVIYAQWLDVALNSRQGAGIDNSSLTSLSLPLAGLVALALIIWLWRRSSEPAVTNTIGIAVSLLASPITWPGYLLSLLPVFASRHWSLPMSASAVLLVLPWPLMAIVRTVPGGWLTWGHVDFIATSLVLASVFLPSYLREHHHARVSIGGIDIGR